MEENQIKLKKIPNYSSNNSYDQQYVKKHST